NLFFHYHQLFLLPINSRLVVPTAKEERRKAFFGEDIHMDVPPGHLAEVVFKPKSNNTGEAVLMKAGVVTSPRCYLNSLGHLVLDDAQKEDEGTYIIKNLNNPAAVKKLILVVKDCALEQVVKYGETYYIHLNQVQGPITLEFRWRHTLQSHEAPSVVLFNQTAVTAEDYVGRLSVSEKRVTLHGVRMTDVGSFTVLDRDGKVRRRNCLNVREHQTFLHLPYGGNLEIELYLHHTNVSIVYRPKSDNVDRVVVDQGVLVTPMDPQLEGRLTVDGSDLFMKKVLEADTGVFKVTDLTGFTVAHVYIEVEPYRLPRLTVAVLAMLALIAFMLLVCLLSCLYKVHKRNEKNKKLLLLAQQTDKGEGQAFRQVVHEAYTRFTEESLLQSSCDKPSESIEVTIKGLEVAKPGRYQALTSDNFLEMSDSGVEFTASGAPLDSDTDAAVTYPSHKPLMNAISPTAVNDEVQSESLETTAVPDVNLTSRTPDSVLSSSPASNPRSLAAATPDGSLCGTASPGTASRGTIGSDSVKTEGGESGDPALKEESAPST
uniref:Uncharacterized LOC103393887 n=1 Tax=Cynoglossus semilaevis TaxID=244447 RepID=A0A3P8WVF0_CYNSE